jgi:hypothetical protein
MNSSLKALAIGYAALVIIAIVISAVPAAAEITTVPQGVCKTINEENCRVVAHKQTIAIVKEHLRGKKYAKSVARLIGRPICGRIVNKFAFTPLRPVLIGWQMKLKDRRGTSPLYSCRL